MGKKPFKFRYGYVVLHAINRKYKTTTEKSYFLLVHMIESVSIIRLFLLLLLWTDLTRSYVLINRFFNAETPIKTIQ